MPVDSSQSSGSGRKVTQPRAEFGFADVLQLCLRRWHLLLLFSALGGFLSVLYWYYTPRIYESASQVLVMRKDSQLATRGVQGEVDGKVGEDLLSTHVQLIQSNRVVKEALSSHELDQIPSILENLRKDETVVDYVVRNLAVTRGGMGQAKGAHVLNIKFRHVSDVDAQSVLEALIDRYQRFLREKFQDVNKEAAELISNARLELEQELKAAESRYLESRRDAPLLWDGEKSTNVHRQRFEAIQTELTTLGLKYSQVVSRLDVVESMSKELKANGAGGLEWLALIDEKDSARYGAFTAIFQGETATAAFQSLQPARISTAQTEASELLKLIVKEKTLAQEFGPNHPEYISTKEQIGVIRDYLKQADHKNRVNGGDRFEELDPERIANSYIKLLQHDRKSLEGHIAELTAKAEKEEAAAKLLIDYELEDQTIRKEVKRKQELFDAVVDRLRDINLAHDYGGFINEVISPPEIGEKVWPKLSLCLVLGVLFGMILGGAGVALAEFQDRSFRNPAEVASALELPVLSQLPNLVLNSKKGKGASAVCATLCVVHRPKSREAEVFRSLRTALFSKCSSDKFKIVGFTSPNPGDGKSTAIANLAVSIAQAGRRVLLIDCDLRKPRQHVQFAMENRLGVTNILRDDTDVFDAIQETSVAGLSLLSAGPSVANPAEILDSPRFAQLLEMVRERFDFVLVDTPPVLAVSDPCIIAPQFDLMLMVIRVSRDSRPQAIQAKSMLAEVGTRILGTVLNGCDAPAHFFGQYGAASRKSGAYYEDEDSEKGMAHKPSDQPAGVNGTRPLVKREIVETQTNGRHNDEV